MVDEQVPKENADAVAPTKVEVKKRTSARKKPAKKVDKAKKIVVFVKSKRKSAIARASAKQGTGKIRVNGYDVNTFEPVELKALMLEPLSVSVDTYNQAEQMSISINVHGGGQSAQAQAIRSAIAKSIVAMSGSESIKKDYMRFDRFMLIDDTRRVEPKKFRGPKARARFQKSYR